MNKYKIQIVNQCQEFLDDLEKYNLPVHNQLCDTIKEVLIHLKVNLKDWKIQIGIGELVQVILGLCIL